MEEILGAFAVFAIGAALLIAMAVVLRFGSAQNGRAAGTTGPRKMPTTLKHSAKGSPVLRRSMTGSALAGLAL